MRTQRSIRGSTLAGTAALVTLALGSALGLAACGSSDKAGDASGPSGDDKAGKVVTIATHDSVAKPG